MKFKGFKSYEGGYITFNIEGGDQMDNLGDQVWFSKCGTLMEVYDLCDTELLTSIAKKFDNGKALLGMFRRITE